MNLEAFQEGSLNKKFNDMASLSYFSTLMSRHEDAVLADELKKDSKSKFADYDKKDYGYLATFEHENETQELLSKKGFQNLFSDILGERDARTPYFFKFDAVNDYCKGKLKGIYFKAFHYFRQTFLTLEPR